MSPRLLPSWYTKLRAKAMRSSDDHEAIELLRRSEHRFSMFLMVVTLVLAVFIAFQVVRVSNQVQAQTTFIIEYLRCVGQRPVGERGPSVTNDCFERHAEEVQQ